MNKLKEAREKIDDIDGKILKLFVARMNILEDVLEYKIKHNLEIFDEKREEEVIKKNVEKLDEPKLIEYYIEFIKNLMSISKRYQREKLNK